MGLLLVFVTFGWSYLTVLPAFAKEELGLDARGFAILQALNGAGALLGALWVAAAAAPAGRASLRRTIFGTIAVSGLAVAAFGLAPGGFAAGAALVVAGAGGVGFLSRGNALVQEIVPDRLRGRVMALWVLVFIGGMALGGALLGAAADAWGARAAIAGSGLLCVLLAAAVMAGLGPAGEEPSGPR
jgi:MFS family permease